MPDASRDSLLIDQQTDLDAACDRISATDEICIDTEFARTDTYQPKLCLLQISVASRIHCIDALSQLDDDRLWQLICAGSGMRVLHAAKQDLEVFWIRCGSLPGQLFDTQVAAGLTGHPAQCGYAALVKALLGIEVDKTHTRADWSRRPLTPALIDYAAADVAHLPELGARLREQLRALGRYDWAIEDCQRLLDPALYMPAPERAWERLGGLNRMPARAQACARRLARWREESAVRANRPRQWILSDRALLDIAMRMPGTLQALADCQDVPDGLIRRRGHEILQEIEQAGTDPASNVDTLRVSPDAPVEQRHIRELGKVVDSIAGQLGIAAEILATRRDLTALLRGERDARPLQGWRRAVIGEPLQAALPG
jgi:ribonuclease D